MAHVVIIGAGPVGLVTSILLAADGHRATVLDRDPTAARTVEAAIGGDWRRPGVKQFGHTHILMPAGYRLLDKELPGAVDRIREAGGYTYSMLSGAWKVPGADPGQAGDERFETITARRPVLEAALFATAAETPGVRILGGTKVVSLFVGEARTSGRPHIAGVVTDSGARIEADLVVDASGRRTDVPELLAQVGGAPEVIREEAGFRYYTRYFRADERGVPAPRTWPLTHHNSISVITAPGDGDTWSTTLVTSDRDQELRPLSRVDVWNRVLALYPHAAHWNEGVPLTDVHVMGGTHNTLRCLVAGEQPAVTGILAIGDARMTTNPQFGMGMTTGLRHAVRLRDALRLLGTDDAVELALHVDRGIDAESGPGWADDTAWARHRTAEIDAEMRGERYATDDPAWALRTAVEAVFLKDPEILRAWGDVGSMLATADAAFVETGLVERVIQLGAEAPRYPEPGPDRAELLTAVRDGEPGPHRGRLLVATRDGE
ncbi:FAD-dependent oxidoreductase [Streptomyces albicerus]|uniref:FAD-dependent oxidoreductase n=1 Tax=Streptomyces albicerus TaxID=2569859 RepID=UPI00124B1138|nr:NAD(P)/FAD-dependent oxidoreductase [Streptomyces albicerus]